MAGAGPVLSGILNLYKPAGPTSHDMVARVRRLVGQRQVGHAGTLDPLAQGVLLICLGAATRVSQYLMDAPKTYLAQVTLGATSITDDAEGALTPGRPARCTRADVLRVLGRFLGEIQQTPPLYAAIKRDGVPQYKLARRGAAVTPRPRPVHIQAIHLLDWQPPHLSLLVTCHAGTYIRALARDVGAVLGCGGYLSGLVRVRSGRFTAGDAVTLEQLELAATAGFVADLLYPVDTALLDRAAVLLGPDSVARLRQGQALPAHGRPAGPAPYRAYSRAGELVALVAHRGGGDRAVWQPLRVFAATDTPPTG